jgi:subtilisin family serine protease
VRIRIFAAVGLIGLLIPAGCNSSSSVAATPSPSTSPSPSSSALPTREEGGKQYVTIVAQSNTALDRWGKRCGDDFDFVTGVAGQSEKDPRDRLANLKSCAIDLGKSHRRFAADLRAARWPAEAQPDIEALARLVDVQAYAEERMAKASTENQFAELTALYPSDEGIPDQVRARLGLPKRSTS